METRQLPPLAMPILIAVGFAAVLMMSISVGLCVTHLRDTKEHGKGSVLGRWAWALSCVSLLVPYLSPITLVMGGIDLARNRNSDLPPWRRRPGKWAVLNSLVAIASLTAVFGVFVFGWTK